MELKKLKKAWQEALNAQERIQELESLRENLCDQIQSLKIEKDSVINQKLESQAESLEKAIQNKKKELLSIDEELDRLEEISPETVDALNAALLEEIFAAYPQEKIPYQQLEEELTEILSLEEKSVEILAFIKTLIGHLEEIQRIRKKIQKRRIFSYIFGKSPNVQISKELKHIEHRIAEILLRLESLKKERLGGTQFTDILENLTDELKKIQKRCQEPWGFKTLDTTFKECLKELIHYDTALSQIKQFANEREEAIQEQLKAWLEKF